MHAPTLALISALCFAALAGSSAAQKDRLTLTGTVLDHRGKALPGARVSIATAAVRRGFSPY